MRRPKPRERRSARSTSARVIALFAILFLVTGGGSLALGQRQADDFASTTSRSESEMGTLAMLQRSVLEVDDSMSAVLYEFDRDEHLAQQWRHWRSGHREAAALFDQLIEVVESHGPEEAPVGQATAVRQLRAQWLEVGEGVADARKRWGTGEVSVELAEGADPFPTLWEDYRSIQFGLAELSVESVGAMRTASDRASRNHDVTEAMIAAAIVIALLVGFIGVRSMSKRIINPLVTLRSSVVRLQRGELDHGVEVPRTAGAEVAELAEAIAAMAAALGASQAHLRDQANTDGLTGLANRRAFADVLDEACRRGSDSRTSVLLIDIDDFKDVNDSLGHAAGDEVLAAVAARLLGQARATDTVARIGGDEFAMIIRGDDSLGAALAVAERMMVAFGEEFEVDGVKLHVSCSVGIADGIGAVSGEDIVRHADAAMYVAKGRGKNCFEALDPMLHATMLSRSALKDELNGAASDDQLELHYQPVIDLDSDQVIGFEALVRWRHPERGLLLPAAFLDTAEECGAIVAIGDWVIDRACRDLSRLQSVWTGNEPLWIAVNVSARQVGSGGLVETVRRALETHAIAAESLVLELTEAQLLSDPTQASAVLEALRAEGARIAIDDFGTGFSSLQYLTDLPIDILKIDRAFVQEPSGGDADGIIVLEAIAAMGQGLGLMLIAEGIEEQVELERLRRLGSMAGQGYLFAHPMTVEDALVLFDCRSLAMQ